MTPPMVALPMLGSARTVVNEAAGRASSARSSPLRCSRRLARPRMPRTAMTCGCVIGRCPEPRCSRAAPARDRASSRSARHRPCASPAMSCERGLSGLLGRKVGPWAAAPRRDRPETRPQLPRTRRRRLSHSHQRAGIRHVHRGEQRHRRALWRFRLPAADPDRAATSPSSTSRDAPKVPLRMLDHWDNLDGTIERGYAGRSLWDWQTLPAVSDPRYIDYARANASIGINGVVLNNVNANARHPDAALPREGRGARRRRSGRTASASISRRASRADRDRRPADRRSARSARSRAWWRAKADEIYRADPRLRRLPGQGQLRRAAGPAGLRPHPRRRRQHAGRRARAARRHRDVARLRLSAPNAEDRAKQAYDEFVPLDGKFATTSSSRSRTARSTSSRASRSTRCSARCRARRSRWKCRSRRNISARATHRLPRADVEGGAATPTPARPRCGDRRSRDTIAGIAGVANTGSDRNWTGSDFDQANWYAFGRLAWNPRSVAARSPTNGCA